MRFIRGTLAILLLAAGTAADDKPEPTKADDAVSGKVTLNGKPLPAGWITFHGKGGRSVAVNIDDGKYSLKNAPTGQVRVTIETASIAATAEAMRTQLQQLEFRAKLIEQSKKEKDAELAKRIDDLKGRVKVLTEMQKKLGGIKVHEKYADRNMTPLVVEVKGGAETFDIEL